MPTDNLFFSRKVGRTKRSCRCKEQNRDKTHRGIAVIRRDKIRKFLDTKMLGDMFLSSAARTQRITKSTLLLRHAARTNLSNHNFRICSKAQPTLIGLVPRKKRLDFLKVVRLISGRTETQSEEKNREMERIARNESNHQPPTYNLGQNSWDTLSISLVHFPLLHLRKIENHSAFPKLRF